MNESKFAEMVKILEGFRANGIRPSGKSLDVVLRFQDIVGTSSNNDIIEMWTKQMTAEDSLKKLFIWAVTATCGFEIAEHCIELTMGNDAKRKVLKQFKDEYDRLEKEEELLGARKTAISQKECYIQNLEDSYQQIQTIINRLK